MIKRVYVLEKNTRAINSKIPVSFLIHLTKKNSSNNIFNIIVISQTARQEN